MDVFEAIHTVQNIRVKDGPSRKIIFPEDSDLFEQAREALSDDNNYLHLSKAQGKLLASQALALVEHELCMKQYLPHHILEMLSKYMPGSLEDAYRHILEHDLFFDDGSVFQDAQAETRDLLLTRLQIEDTPHRQQKYIAALAWIRDEVAVQTFREWLAAPPPWYRSTYPIETLILWAGWELTPEGNVRDLYLHNGYELHSDGPVKEQQAGPINIFRETNHICRWCGRPMVNCLDLDQHESRLRLLSTPTSSIRLLFCVNCSVQEIIFSNLTDSSWSEKTPDPAFSLNLDYWKDMEDRKLQAREQVVLGNQGHATGRHGRYWISTPSQLGGLPQWVQEPDYPQCPSCQQRMIYMGQVEIGDFDLENDGSGVLFFFLCSVCQLGTYDIQCD